MLHRMAQQSDQTGKSGLVETCNISPAKIGVAAQGVRRFLQRQGYLDERIVRKG